MLSCTRDALSIRHVEGRLEIMDTVAVIGKDGLAGIGGNKTLVAMK